MSLSIVFGTPTTAHATPRSRHSSSMASAPACDPLPPMTNKKSNPIAAIASTMSAVSLPPLLEPRMLPPSRWIVSTTSPVRRMGALSSPSVSKNPRKPYRTPTMSSTPYSSRVNTNCRTTSFRPGHRPPHVTMAALTALGSWRITARGPARVAHFPFHRSDPISHANASSGSEKAPVVASTHSSAS